MHKEIGKTEEKEITANKNIIAKNNNEIKEVIKDLEGPSRHKHKHSSRHINPEKVIENDHDSNDNFLDIKDNDKSIEKIDTTSTSITFYDSVWHYESYPDPWLCRAAHSHFLPLMVRTPAN